MGGELKCSSSAEICSCSGLHSLHCSLTLAIYLVCFSGLFPIQVFHFNFCGCKKMSLFLVAEIIRTMGRSDGAIVSVKQKIYNPKNDLFLFSSIRCEHLRPANNFFRHNKWFCVWFSDFLPPPTATLMRVSAIHDSLTPGYDENCPSLAVSGLHVATCHVSPPWLSGEDCVGGQTCSLLLLLLCCSSRRTF